MTEPVFYLGDSHVRYFRRAAANGLLMPFELAGIEVGGATAVGMRNPNAKTNAIGRFREWIRDKPVQSTVLLHLGEVDCGFVIWYRAAKYSEPIDFQMGQSIDAYFEFVDELIGLGFGRIVVTGATLPTITDEDQTGEVVIKRSSITATQFERTQLTASYNARLSEEASRRGLPFVDIAEDIIDAATGVVSSRMRNPNPDDHHMNGDRAGAFWARRLRPVLGAPAGQEAPHTWTCVYPSYVKAYPAHSRWLASDMRVDVNVGDVVAGYPVGAFGDYLAVEGLTVNGVPAPLARMIHPKHYKST